MPTREPTQVCTATPTDGPASAFPFFPPLTASPPALLWAPFFLLSQDPQPSLLPSHLLHFSFKPFTGMKTCGFSPSCLVSTDPASTSSYYAFSPSPTHPNIAKAALHLLSPCVTPFTSQPPISRCPPPTNYQRLISVRSPDTSAFFRLPRICPQQSQSFKHVFTLPLLLHPIPMSGVCPVFLPLFAVLNCLSVFCRFLITTWP